jgi:hypothetical protein
MMFDDLGMKIILHEETALGTEKYDGENNRLNNESKQKSVSLSFLELKPPESKASNESNADDSEYSLFDQCESPWTRVRLRELDSESPIPGFKARKIKNGRVALILERTGKHSSV